MNKREVEGPGDEIYDIPRWAYLVFLLVGMPAYFLSVDRYGNYKAIAFGVSCSIVISSAWIFRRFRGEILYWLMLSIFIACHAILLVFIDFPADSLTLVGTKIYPFVMIDVTICIGSMHFLFIVMRKNKKEREL